MGSLLDLGRDPLKFVTDAHARYGDVWYTTLGKTQLYALCTAELVEEALLGRHRDCVKDVDTRRLIPLVLVLATLAQQLDLTLAPGFQLELEPSITLRLKSGLPMVARRVAALEA